MSQLKGSKTEKNLQEAFAGEAMARNKYTFYSSVARKEGFEQIAALFLETAEQEREHAKLHFKYLDGIHGTAANLQAAADGERYETTEMYPRMAAEARAEGFEEIARHFENVAKVEARHEARYLKLLANVKGGEVFAKPGRKLFWACRNCGFVHEGEAAPATCPACKHPQAYFEIKADNF